MEITSLYNLAEIDNISVVCFDLLGCECLSYLDDDSDCHIAIDPNKLKNYADEKVKLAHEIGHCETGAFYNKYALCDIRRKHEHRADCWAIKELIPEDELIKVLKKGYKNRFELAEYFGVTEEFMQKALDFYAK